ncbi:hypothetical protein T4C_2683 [Trichinella pseudospiralis]|uniref:Uncharacterized protein n=1 Tax=Trichinella pseudospiralis TaxID=6337 RepID=A0A0V1JU06_TRIPS|nr:hypothetical protein T4D_13453 [Trichinella pseudospiralis]KRZ38434.1 hypothetical protein T4C_2683 [Trichinella pseudospiralis]
MGDYNELFMAKLKLLVCCMDDYKCCSDLKPAVKAFSKDHSSNDVSSTNGQCCSDDEQNVSKEADSKDVCYVSVFAQRLRDTVAQMEMFLQRFGAQISANYVEETVNIIKQAKECLDDADT